MFSDGEVHAIKTFSEENISTVDPALTHAFNISFLSVSEMRTLYSTSKVYRCPFDKHSKGLKCVNVGELVVTMVHQKVVPHALLHL